VTVSRSTHLKEPSRRVVSPLASASVVVLVSAHSKDPPRRVVRPLASASMVIVAIVGFGDALGIDFGYNRIKMGAVAYIFDVGCTN
jgi:hypothetical protein